MMSANMWMLAAALLVQTVCALVYSSKDGVTIKFIISSENSCQSEGRRIAVLHGVSVAQCAKECGLRKHCAALNFKRRANVCELLSSNSSSVIHNVDCIYIRASDIEVIQKPCGDCAYGEICDLITKKCIYKECLETITNGDILGNVKATGAVIRYRCKDGYADRNGVINANCRQSGQWSSKADCARACGGLPSIANGTAVLDKANGQFYLDTATVTCESWYQTTNTVITCTETGDWETASCTDCYLNTTQAYTGKTNSTVTGWPCKRWDETTEYNLVNHDLQYLPDASVSAAENYCRNPSNNYNVIWCYSTRPDKLFELCDVQKCQ